MNGSGFFKGRPQVRWGIIGCGDVTEVKSGPGFRKAERSALVAVMRRNAALAQDYARRHGVPRWYDDAQKLIHDPEVDAVYIATPPDTHESYALQVAAVGKPAYVEKPMARNGAECDRMVEAFQGARLPLFVAYYRRRLPRFVAAKALVASGRIGRLTGIRYVQTAPKHRDPAAWRVDATSAGGGLFLDVGSHVLDYLDELAGPLTGVSGTASRLAGSYAVEDCVSMSFRARGGVVGSGHWNFAAERIEERLSLDGTEGRLSFEVFSGGPLLLETPAGTEAIEKPTPPHIAQPLIQSVVDDLLGLEECPSTGESARRTSRVMDQVLEGYYGGRGDAFWERADRWPGSRPD
jgi:1,5-anhydro-D-fructose reductase (1,5-anhydro-D-mannitol-forming)